MNNCIILLERINDLEEMVKFYKYDSLTGFKTRKDFDNELDKLINLNIDKTVCFIDLNNLHTINRERGYEYGDEYISINSVILKQLFSEENIYRIGGDEFAIITDLSISECVRKLSAFKQNYCYSCDRLSKYLDRKEIMRKLDRDITNIKSKLKKYRR